MPNGSRDAVLASIASTIADYRMGAIPQPSPEHVDEWVKQFDAAVQVPILAEMDHVLKKTYINRRMAEESLASVLGAAALSGPAPREFWKRANFLEIQQQGRSQSELLAMLETPMNDAFGLSIRECGSEEGPYIYLDDAIFTGNRIKNDLNRWINSGAPASAVVHVVTFAFHRGGRYYADQGIAQRCKEAGKAVATTYWGCLEIEDRRAYINSSDVLRPTVIPSDVLSRSYADAMKHPPVFRKPGNVGEMKFFSSEQGRNLLEQEFLKAGTRIRSMCPLLNEYQRPLGNMVLETLGFGAMVVTFRNCPNNAPLALWAGDPWYPLFPRRTN